VSRNRIFALVVTSLLLVMLGALIYEAFDIHDTQPFGVDPELPLFMLGSLLVLCIGVVALGMRLLEKHLSNPETVPIRFLDLLLCLMGRKRAFEIERLLFSPPRAIVSLRI